MIQPMLTGRTDVLRRRSLSVPWVLLCASTTCILATPGLAAADLDRTVDFHIPAQPLDGALLEFSRQARIQLAINAGSLRTIEAPPVNGTLPVSTALAELLVHSGLEYGTVGSTVTIAPIAHAASAPAATLDQNSIATPSQPGAPSSSGTVDDVQTAWPLLVEEIIVSAQKRDERLQDVPVPVTAISAVSLIENNQPRLQDYYSQVPGLGYTPGDLRGGARLTIRGVTTGGLTNPTVGVTVDDVPYGSSSNSGLGYEVPDLDPTDLQRVEVLRGPQGTLYGASSIGGLLKFVTVDPSTDAMAGRIQTDVDSLRHGEQTGYGVRGAVNVPLSDTVAVRASGFSRRDPGYIDNVQTGEKGVNVADVYGGRLSALWRPSDALSLKLSALVQNNKRKGSPEVDIEPGLVDWQQSTLRGTGDYAKKTEIYGANLNAKLGEIDLTSVSSYSRNTLFDSIDYTKIFGFFTDSLFGVTATPYVDHIETKKITQEIRVSGRIGQKLEWLGGAFYNHEHTGSTTDILGADPDTGAAIGSVADLPQTNTFAEYAGFADLTVLLTDRFNVQLGARESENKQTSSTTYIGPYAIAFFNTSPFVYPELETRENSFTYLVTPQLKISTDLMVYARLASGYRPGGPNSAAAIVNLPKHFAPDKTQSYELGLKGNVLEHRLSFDASAYYIDWKNIQVFLVDPLTQNGYNSNGSRAKSQGLEISFDSQPFPGLNVAGWVAWNDAVLTEPFPPTSSAFGASGDRLPYSSRFSSNLSVEDDLPLYNTMTGFVAASVSYVGSRLGVFGTPAAPQRQTFPDYAQTDLRTGVKYDSWTVNLFLNNATDRRGVLAGGVGTTFPYAFTYIQPRTIGLSASKSF